MRVYTEDDLHKNLLKRATVAILGFGNQGHAHALNLRDNGITTVVGTRRGGTGWEQAAKAGFDSVGISEAAAEADAVVILLPDEVQGTVFREEIAPALKPGSVIIFPHGFTVAFGVVELPPGHDVVLVAPKGQGHYLRKMFMAQQGLPCLVGVEQDISGDALQKSLSYASLIGCLSTGAIETTFREEAITDLFGEQTVLCGGTPKLVMAAFETLVDAGFSPEVAYLECLHELKIIVDLMHQGGMRFMRERISRTAAWGSFETGDKIVTPEVKRTMEEVLERIRSGEFARDWLAEEQAGQKNLKQKIEKEARHPIEKAGRRVRSLMPYLNEEI
ncbi:MAG: ketol-acid reductoisomerase [Candidatus Latescibacterota bacterium]|jgi:ketol-acid reductoisomerase